MFSLIQSLRPIVVAVTELRWRKNMKRTRLEVRRGGGALRPLWRWAGVPEGSEALRDLAGQSESSPYHITTMYVHTHHLLAEVESNRQNPLATPDCMLMRLGSANRGLN